MLSGSVDHPFDGVRHYTQRLLQEMAVHQNYEFIWVGARRKRASRFIWREKNVLVLAPIFNWLPRSVLLLKGLLKLLRADIIHVQEQIHSFHETNAVPSLLGSFNCPKVITLHEFHIERESVQSTIQAAELSDYIIANDERNAQRCAEFTRVEVNQVLWSGSNVKPLPTPVAIRPYEICTFGHISGLKGIAELYGVLKEARKTYPKLRWNIVGPFHPEKNEEHRCLKELMNEEWVTFTGGYEDLDSIEMRSHLARCHIMILPFTDGATMRRGSLQAAWAFKKPVITTQSEHTEVGLREGGGALFVPADAKAEQWKKVINSFFSNADVEQRLQNEAHQRSEQFSWEKLAQIHQGVYSQLIEEGNK